MAVTLFDSNGQTKVTWNVSNANGVSLHKVYFCCQYFIRHDTQINSKFCLHAFLYFVSLYSIFKRNSIAYHGIPNEDYKRKCDCQR